jgi:hypothetical protein
MQQLEIQYFFPLTEQIPLDLDYTKTLEYIEEQRKKLIQNSITLSSMAVGNGYAAVTLTTNAIDWENSTRLGSWEIENNKRKPTFLQKVLMKKIFGMKWMGK